LVNKICCVLVEPKGYERKPALECKQKLFSILRKKGGLSSDVEVRTKSLEKGLKEFYLYTRYTYFEFLTTHYIVEAMIQAEKDGFDAATVACIFDPGIEEARSVLKIPVVGIGEASFILARMLSGGRGIAVVTMSNRAITKINDLIDKYKFRSFMIQKDPVRAVPHDLYIKASTHYQSEDVKKLKEAYLGIAEECVNDGAEVIITGCGGMGPMLAVEGVREVEGAPIVEPISAACIILQTLLDLRKIGMEASTRFTYRPTIEDWKKGRESFNLSP